MEGTSSRKGVGNLGRDLAAEQGIGPKGESLSSVAKGEIRLEGSGGSVFRGKKELVKKTAYLLPRGRWKKYTKETVRHSGRIRYPSGGTSRQEKEGFPSRK